MQRSRKRVLQTKHHPQKQAQNHHTAELTVERDAPGFAGGWQISSDLSQNVIHMQRAVGNAATLRQLKTMQRKSRSLPHGGRLPKALMPLAAQRIQRFASAEHRSCHTCRGCFFPFSCWPAARAAPRSGS